MSIPFELSKTYNFDTYSTSYLGGNHKLKTVVGIMSAKQAMQYRDISTTHKLILPTLPGNTTANPELLTYVLFTDNNNKEDILAVEWINSNSILEVVGVTVELVISDIANSDIAIITDVLRNLGYTNLVTNIVV